MTRESSVADALWSDACRQLDRAERLRREFFRLGRSAPDTAWEPPVDVIDTPAGLIVCAAIPNLIESELSITLDGDALVLCGRLRMPRLARDAVIHRLELPYGALERRLPLPAGEYAIDTHAYTAGCLTIRLRRRRRR